MRKQKSAFKREITRQGYFIDAIHGNDFILKRDGLTIAIEVIRGEPLAETMARVQLNYDTIKRVNRLVMERRRLMQEQEQKEMKQEPVAEGVITWID